MLKTETKKLFQKYLREHSLSEPLNLGKNGILKFHWANDKIASGYIRHLHDSSKKQNTRLEQLKEELEYLKDIPIWMMSKRGQIKSDLYNLYSCYLDPRLKHQWFELEEILVSLQHEAGPFSSIKAMRWFDRDVYAKFIYLKLVEAWAPQRSFRLSMHIPIVIRGGNSPFNSVEGSIHQVSEHGIVVHISSCALLKEWGHLEDIVFLKKEMKLVQEKGLDSCLQAKEWVKGLENFSVKSETFQELLQTGLQGQGDKDNFLFIPLKVIQMMSVKNHERSMANYKSLFDEAEMKIHEYITAAA